MQENSPKLINVDILGSVLKNPKERYYVLDKETIKISLNKYNEEYLKHLKESKGCSGWTNPISGFISSFRNATGVLNDFGYKDLNFCNGGDDDWLILDTQNKEYGFFEDFIPLIGNSLNDTI